MGDAENARRIRPEVGADARSVPHGAERVALPSAVGAEMASMRAPSVCIEDISIVFMHSWSYVKASSSLSSGAPSFITLASTQTRTQTYTNVSWKECPPLSGPKIYAFATSS